MITSETRAAERELRRNERIDRFINAGRTILWEHPDDLPLEVRAVLKSALAGLARHVTKERAAGNLLTRSSSPNGFLSLTTEEKRLLSTMNN